MGKNREIIIWVPTKGDYKKEEKKSGKGVGKHEGVKNNSEREGIGIGEE